MNEFRLIGRVQTVPEIRSTKSGQLVGSMRVSCSKPVGDGFQTSFFTVVGWRFVAEKMKQLSLKQKILVMGRLESREWQDKEGKKRESVEVIAMNVYPLVDEDAYNKTKIGPNDDDSIPF